MVTEVNKIIYNLLVNEHAVYLPGIGTLSVVRRSATMESKNIIAPPTYTIEFSSHASATSVVDAIVHEASTDIVSAEDIYSRWLDKVRSGNALDIEGVGVLRDKSFAADTAFISMFNASSDKKRVKKGGKGCIVALIIALLLFAIFAVLGVAGWLFYDDIAAMFSQPNNATKESVSATNTTVFDGDIEHDAQFAIYDDATNNEVDEVTYAEEQTETIYNDEPKKTTVRDSAPTNVDNNMFSEDWTQRNDIRHWVVVGSYSTEENAETAIEIIEKQHPDTYCKVFSLGWMYAVATYGSADRDDCVKYMRKYRYDYDQMWIFTPKANR